MSENITRPERTSDIWDTHGKAGTGCPKCARLERELAEAKAQWFAKGRESIHRRNESGCCCKIDGSADAIISVCALHQEWAERERDELIERCAAICDRRAYRHNDTSPTREIVEDRVKECAAAIRALKPDAKEEG